MVTGGGAGQKPYTVLKIDELTRPKDSGGFERYYRVKFKTRGGTILTTDVSDRDYTSKKVQPLLEKLAKESDEILSL